MKNPGSHVAAGINDATKHNKIDNNRLEITLAISFVHPIRCQRQQSGPLID